jgi:hypothetical protein
MSKSKFYHFYIFTMSIEFLAMPCRVYLGLQSIHVLSMSIYVLSRAPLSFIHVLCISIYVRTYEPCCVILSF